MLRHAQTCMCDTCPRTIQGPIWPSNSANEIYHRHQMLFNRDDHNHAEVIGERIVTLPLMVPANRLRPPFVFVNATSGTKQTAPFSTDNVMHTNWAPSRELVNVNTPIGSDSSILFQSTIPHVESSDAFYEGTPANQGYDKWKDWLDHGASGGTAADARVTSVCKDDNNATVCAQTCVDWWTLRPVPPQGSLQRPELPSSGGCPINTLQAMACYPCNAHVTYTMK